MLQRRQNAGPRKLAQGRAQDTRYLYIYIYLFMRHYFCIVRPYSYIDMSLDPFWKTNPLCFVRNPSLTERASGARSAVTSPREGCLGRSPGPATSFKRIFSKRKDPGGSVSFRLVKQEWHQNYKTTCVWLLTKRFQWMYSGKFNHG